MRPSAAVVIETIAAYMQLTKARLVVAGKHYGSPRWPRNTRFVSTLTRSAPGPVLVLPSERQSAKRAVPFRHVVSAIDFTVASAVALRTVMDLIQQSGAKLTIVHALNDAQHMVFSGSEAGRAARIRRAILDVASEVDGDLIVMGVPPPSRVDEMLFGSTLRRVLRRAKIPVLVLPVPAGAYPWLEQTDGEGVATTTRPPRRGGRLRASGRRQ